MKKIGFVGAFDKTNLIMYTAKVLQNMDKRVLIIDGTILQKMRYVVPTISRKKTYITEFEKIDFAVGFQSMEQIMEYLQMTTSSEEELPYDYILADIDNRIAYRSFYMNTSEKFFYVTGFDIYSLKRGMDIFTNLLEEQIKLTKILYSNDVTAEDDEYLNYLSLEKNIVWDDMVIYCPLLDSDNKIIEENQRVDKIRVKRLSSNYQQAIIYIVQNILGENAGKIKKSIIE